ncbi:DUF4326 domain-containing protein [Evansella clarkii]|uniref:DUF4326 domain-containing protein n=1 Tax=Evansella clarkii TaxID=79879 RepID=UPI0009966C21|nr:DUF4326 domain-containing protein [Evansella clarkii]
MEKTTVVNKHHKEAFDVYIGRGSKWGNPFSHRSDTKAKHKTETREEAVASYREWIQTQPDLLADLHELKGKKLCCYCKPKACHGDVLAELADALDSVTSTSHESKTVIHIGFTGHRPNKLGGYDLTAPGYLNLQEDLETYIKRNLEVFDMVVGHSGLALGGDTIWSKAILAMKEKYPGRVQFHAEIPMMEQASAWFKKSDIDFWHEQVERADFTSVYGSLDGVEEHKRRGLAAKFLNLRNEGMLDHSNVLLALHDGSSGGTGNAVAYAKETNLVTHVVHPSVYF